MRDEFKITRQGKEYVLFAGLLDEVHERGLQSIDTELIQSPAETNGQTAIIRAVVELTSGQTFSGIGDASPDSVSRNIAPHLIRMAETRAKARALRDAVNVAATSLEELGDDHPEEPRQALQSQSSRSSEEPERTEGGATQKQVAFLRRLLPEHRKNQLEEEHGAVETWSREAVSKMIDRLQQKQGEASG